MIQLGDRVQPHKRSAMLFVHFIKHIVIAKFKCLAVESVDSCIISREQNDIICHLSYVFNAHEKKSL